MSGFETVIGLEVHAQLLTNTKAFCLSDNNFGDEPNSNIGPVSIGLPGALPVLNDKAIELAIRAGVALDCEINPCSIFSRKNYFYPDLPKGYQISQFDKPICTGGKIVIELNENETKTINLERIHMEEDAGKSIHLPSASLINLNRSGVPLIEIVTKPDLRSANEASSYLRKLHAILMFAEVCDGNLEQGNFRCDVNVSVRPIGQKELGTRAEIKNINSFRFVEKAIEFEVARQVAVVQSGQKVIQETRGWDSGANKTFSMRTKENANDYRYFPEPDMPPLIVTEEFINQIRSNMPELPNQMEKRFQDSYNLSLLDAKELSTTKKLSDYFEEVCKHKVSPKLASNWILSELLRVLKEKDLQINESPIEPERLAKMIALIEKGDISGKIAKSVFAEMLESSKLPGEIVTEKGLVQINDEKTINNWIQEVIETSPEQVKSYKEGKTKLFGFFVGQVMKKSAGKANPEILNKLIKVKLS